MKVVICWFRRDLRLHDNAALYHALRSGFPVVPAFIFDTDILDDLDSRADRRLQFIHDALSVMQSRLLKMGSTLHVYHGTPAAAFRHFTEVYEVAGVYANHDYEPYARQRDEAMAAQLGGQGIGFKTYKDQVIFEKGEVLKDNGAPYTVFTPYSRKWKAALEPFFSNPILRKSILNISTCRRSALCPRFLISASKLPVTISRLPIRKTH
ncbi:deoxyribodipyrimidine photo-lyase [Chitinophaga pollutisoli]|uniref:Deoxyribodipyrimidine photo-lyase n=1 Tax=Chitinophaga pollutisoli TaxID=3133966 RepID=A0ABZ2YLE6_9BACT